MSGTYSIVAVDPEAGVCGAAVASRYPAVGKVVPYVVRGSGFLHPALAQPQVGRAALDLLAAGKHSEDVLGELLKDDKRPRQAPNGDHRHGG